MKIFKVFGGFSDGQADGVRKCVAKKQLDKMDYYFDLFRKGARKNGYADDVIENIINFAKENASYSPIHEFNSSYCSSFTHHNHSDLSCLFFIFFLRCEQSAHNLTLCNIYF